MDHCQHVGGWCTGSEYGSWGWRSSCWGGPHKLVGEHLKNDKVTRTLTWMHWMCQFISAFRAWDPKLKKHLNLWCQSDAESSGSFYKNLIGAMISVPVINKNNQIKIQLITHFWISCSTLKYILAVSIHTYFLQEMHYSVFHMFSGWLVFLHAFNYRLHKLVSSFLIFFAVIELPLFIFLSLFLIVLFKLGPFSLWLVDNGLNHISTSV